MSNRPTNSIYRVSQKNDRTKTSDSDIDKAAIDKTPSPDIFKGILIAPFRDNKKLSYRAPKSNLLYILQFEIFFTLSQTKYVVLKLIIGKHMKCRY